MRVGVCERTFKTFAAEQHHKTVPLARLNDHFGVADFFNFLRQQLAKFFANGSFDASGASIGDDSFFIQRAKIRPRCDVAGVQFQPEPQRLDYAAAHLKFERVVAEQSQVTGAAARSDARSHWKHPTLRGVFAQAIESRCCRCFQRRQVGLLAGGDIPQTVEHEQDEFGVRF